MNTDSVLSYFFPRSVGAAEDLGHGGGAQLAGHLG